MNICLQLKQNTNLFFDVNNHHLNIKQLIYRCYSIKKQKEIELIPS